MLTELQNRTLTPTDNKHYTLEECAPDVSITNPFEPAALHTLYDRDGLLSMGITYDAETLEHGWHDSRQNADNFINLCADRLAFKRLLEDGLIVTPFGMDFSKVQEKRYCVPTQGGNELLHDKDVSRVRAAFYATRVSSFMWDVDMPFWYRPIVHAVGLSESNREQLASFRKDGFLMIDHWDGLDNNAIEALKNGNFQSADALVHPGSFLQNMVLGYLGADAEYHGPMAFNLGPSASRSTYSNSPWHHDGCGQRLKAFIYLHDVTAQHIPTLIAAGTNHYEWYPNTQFFAGPRQGHNKLNESLILETYGSRINKMMGSVGGGFIFDTNNLHAADVAGKHFGRNVVILEFSTQKHMKMMDRTPRNADDNYMSGFVEGLCPARNARIPMPISSIQSSAKFIHD